jgi:transposase
VSGAIADFILGIDVSKKQFHVELLRPAGRSSSRAFANRAAGFAQLARWLGQQQAPRVHACLEATGVYGDALARFLHQAGHCVSVVNPRQIHAFAHSELARNKTDALDAALIARFCQAQHPPAWSPPPLEMATLEALVRRLEALEQMRQQEANRLEVAAPAVRSSITAHLEFLDQQIRLTQQDIHRHLDDHPELRQRRDLLTSIPGIAEKTAAKLLAEIPRLDQFTQVRQLVAFAGLNPRQWNSGSSVHRRARLSKIGSPRLRHALYMPALVALRYNPLIRDLDHRLRSQGKPRMLIVGAAMRKLLHLVFGVLKSGLPFNPTHSTHFLLPAHDGI